MVLDDLLRLGDRCQINENQLAKLIPDDYILCAKWMHIDACNRIASERLVILEEFAPQFFAVSLERP